MQMHIDNNVRPKQNIIIKYKMIKSSFIAANSLINLFDFVVNTSNYRYCILESSVNEFYATCSKYHKIYYFLLIELLFFSSFLFGS